MIKKYMIAVVCYALVGISLAISEKLTGEVRFLETMTEFIFITLIMIMLYCKDILIELKGSKDE